MDDLSAEKFVDNLLSKEAYETPSDSVKPNELVMELPEWFDEEKFNRGRKFYREFSLPFSTSVIFGLTALFAIPSILRILASTRRANSTYTAYRRYRSTLLHVNSWYEHELKPGSMSWKSLQTVRSRHIRAGLAGKTKGIGTVSQRDVALTQFIFVGLPMLKPEVLGIRQLQDGDWDGFNHFWRTIGYMLGLEDRYNICRKTVEETRQVCQIIQDRVFTPCLENVPEHFEHAARSMLDGLSYVNPGIDTESYIWWSKYLADVPGYIYNEKDRITLQNKLRAKLQGKPLDTGVDSTSLIQKSALEGLPDLPPRLLYYSDYNSLEDSPAYKQLNTKNKYKLFLVNLYIYIYGCSLGRWFFNTILKFSLFLTKYFPFLAFYTFGIKASLGNIFEEDPKDDTKLGLNSEYKVKKELSWYDKLFAVFW